VDAELARVPFLTATKYIRNAPSRRRRCDPDRAEWLSEAGQRYVEVPVDVVIYARLGPGDKPGRSWLARIANPIAAPL